MFEFWGRDVLVVLRRVVRERRMMIVRWLVFLELWDSEREEVFLGSKM